MCQRAGEVRRRRVSAGQAMASIPNSISAAPAHAAAVIENWLDAHPASARLADADHATEARMIVNFSITLGDEVMRLVSEDGGDFPFDPAVFRTVRERMRALSVPAW